MENETDIDGLAVRLLGIKTHEEDLAIRASKILSKDAKELKAHDKARDEAAQKYRKAIAIIIALIAAYLLFGKTRKQIQKAIQNYWIALMGETSKKAYEEMSHSLGALIPESSMGSNFVSEKEAEEFSKTRRKYLHKFPQNAFDKLSKAAEKKDGETDEEVQSRVHDTTLELEKNEGELVAQTEAQATYGSSQMRMLQRAGFSTKIWITMEDEKVRQSHNLCSEQGAIKLGSRFQNGLMFPGDPIGGPEEVCNCRCWLIGGAR